ncbi:MAG: 50S ribosomal protein L18, partial [Spirulinaceae cyanobacterium]
IYAQIIDDQAQHTIAAASTLDPDLKSKIPSGATCEASSEVGKLVAARAKEQGIEKVVFDRGGNLYHGRVKALADAAREGGLDF